MKLSANLGFLYSEYDLPDAIRAAARAGFDAVECHWPYATPAADVASALQQTGLPMLGLNTLPGDVAAGDNGLSAIPGREAEARAAIDRAIEYAAATGTRNIHVMAGYAQGAAARETFIENLRYATCQSAESAITILIEPLNHHDAPGYFLQTSTQAGEIIAELDAPNLKLMLDCYHLQIMEGDISRRLAALLPIIGHVQIASVPDRAEPDHGELNYAHVFGVLRDLGYDAPVGAEYKPAGKTDDGLAWMERLKSF